MSDDSKKGFQLTLDAVTSRKLLRFLEDQGLIHLGFGAGTAEGVVHATFEARESGGTGPGRSASFEARESGGTGPGRAGFEARESGGTGPGRAGFEARESGGTGPGQAAFEARESGGTGPGGLTIVIRNTVPPDDSK